MKTFLSFCALLLILLLSFSACSRVTQQDITLKQCLIDQSAVGDDFLESIGELEKHLLETGILRSTSRDDYNYMLREIISGQISLNSFEVAPHVRDYWMLENPSSFAAYPNCIRELTDKFDEPAAASAYRMSEVYSDDPGQIMRADVDLIYLSDSITDDDWSKLLYRGALLVFVVQMAD